MAKNAADVLKIRAIDITTRVIDVIAPGIDSLNFRREKSRVARKPVVKTLSNDKVVTTPPICFPRERYAPSTSHSTRLMNLLIGLAVEWIDRREVTSFSKAQIRHINRLTELQDGISNDDSPDFAPIEPMNFFDTGGFQPLLSYSLTEKRPILLVLVFSIAVHEIDSGGFTSENDYLVAQSLEHML
ncbi:hypothetical protein WN51_13658 [Melipona quadrifasciata]|uniref:Uncharacterized protein n=1 Tax=Melipona quadrifasciata TaxID=166423 RepID=A0A0N0BFN4_9HYME|nr:hypothetical protein WN51_13658 [Melipona quadrifasciata]